MSERPDAPAASGREIDYPFRETFNELIALAESWEAEAKASLDPMERVVLNVCASQLQGALGV